MPYRSPYASATEQVLLEAIQERRHLIGIAERTGQTDSANALLREVEDLARWLSRVRTLRKAGV